MWSAYGRIRFAPKHSIIRVILKDSMRDYTKIGSRGRILGQVHWGLPSQYKCVGIINETKVLEYQGSEKHHNKFPDISHTKGTAYILKVKK